MSMVSAHRAPTTWSQRNLRAKAGRHRRQRLIVRVAIAAVALLVLRTQVGA